ncbi:alpha/beta hydrolase-fold protein [Streptomyces sp. G-G2]|uniref:alpha/beta hydrolase n=1 Tax=Streptomyces sp. G-G2 TaxID=3046201 RepID=UPI0024B8B287|nr:alpha/beta hydrolase-fold protein [Streptomyces sp. G-G2]MDJ0380080.1 alpha/beta hydrolase-fold protein [Streptomyces sp. G-G2]
MSNAVLVLAVLGVVSVFAAAVWLWPRLARRGWRPVLGRVGLILTAQVLVLATIGLVANRTFLLYGSWSDLAAGQKTETQSAGPAGGSAVKVLGRQKPEVPGAADPRSAGVIEKVMVRGDRSKQGGEAYVYLPPEYFQKGNEKRKFPTTVVLTGYPGMAENLVRNLRYPRTAWTLAKEKKMQPMILVMMRPTVVPFNSQCIDIPGGPATETFFGADLPRAISTAYRTGSGPRQWAIMGDSTGGYCALKMGLQHQDTYSVSIGLSADYKPEVDQQSGDLFHGDKKLEKRSDLMNSLESLPKGKSSFLVTTSLQGESNLKPTREFIAKVKDRASVSSISLDHGGHGFNTWRREIPPAMEWLGARLGK